jgi:hypothetical protein
VTGSDHDGVVEIHEGLRIAAEAVVEVCVGVT